MADQKERDGEIDELRESMGTLPHTSLIPETEIHFGVEGIEAELISSTSNPYKNIFEAVVATWGNESYTQKWEKVTPQNRFKVVNAALSGQTLPQALEPVEFMFLIRGASRSAFDQHARLRVGGGFFSQGVRDNSRADAGFRMPSEFGDNPALAVKIINHINEMKKLYVEILERGNGSYQSARSILPMGSCHNYKFYTNLQALRGYMGQRLKACEQEDTCFTAIAIRDAVEKKFPLLASFMKPSCDYAKECMYHKTYTMSELFGCLFEGCGRWPDKKGYATFNKSCSNYEDMAYSGGILLPMPAAFNSYPTYYSLREADHNLFCEA